MKTLSLTKSVGRSPWRNGGILIVVALACFALSAAPTAFGGLSPAPDGGYPNRTTAEGDNALFNLAGGIDNTALGFDALWSTTTGSYNTATGEQTLYLNVSGNYNTGTGYRALYNNTGGKNTADGFRALFTNTTGEQNTASGFQALYFNTGTGNTASGHDALYYNDSGDFSTAVGDFALFRNTTGSGNVAVGYQALSSNTTAGISSQGSVAVGYQALMHQNTSPAANNAVGQNALFNAIDGHYNNAFGWEALFSVTSGTDNTAMGDGTARNINAGSSNTCLGHDSGDSITTGNNIITIGSVSGISSVAGQVDDGCYIDNIKNAPVDAGTASTVFVDQDGKLGTVAFSSQRFKKEITPMGQTSEAVLSLKPVTFQYKYDNKAARQFGLIAEDVAEANPDLVVHDKNGEILAVRYDAVTAMLLNEFLKEHKKVDTQEVTIAQLKKDLQATAAQQQEEIKALTATLKQQAKQIERVNALVTLTKPVPQLTSNN